MSNELSTTLLLILDGFGHREEAESNAILAAHTPNYDKLYKTCPKTLISGCGEDVGLTEGQMGNSEVGHLNIGSGRIVYQQGTRITHDIKTQAFFSNPVFKSMVQEAYRHQSNIHIMQLLSPGGVHSDEEHLFALLKLIKDELLSLNTNSGSPFKPQVLIHAFLDGRDMPPKSAKASIIKLNETIQSLGLGRIATLSGRYYAMDRDQRWDRVEKAYRILTNPQDFKTSPLVDPIAALEQAYAKGLTDEFVEPIALDNPGIQDNDALMFLNFRADRARQLSHALVDKVFTHFPRPHKINLCFFGTLTEYEPNLTSQVAYEVDNLTQTFGEVISHLGYKQLRIAETEKFAHVTFFFNGGVNEPFKGEDRILVPSPKVATYDLQPQMSAPQLTEQLIAAIRSKEYKVIICNYANADMVGHSGNFEAAKQAIECLDVCIAQIIGALKEVNGQMLLTADHGNAEMMQDPTTHEPHTAHTTELVPLVYYGPQKGALKSGGRLCDVAPTLLHLMKLEKPSLMTGDNLFEP